MNDFENSRIQTPIGFSESIRAVFSPDKDPVDVINDVCEIVKQYKSAYPDEPIHYISGKVTADGVEGIRENLSLMSEATDQVKTIASSEVVFSAQDIFPEAKYWESTIKGSDHPEDFYTAWEQVLVSGITDVHMMKGWEDSSGASFENKRAKELNLSIHLPQ